MSDEEMELSDQSTEPPHRHPTKHMPVGPVDSEDDSEVIEKDPEERFHRYAEEIGKGKFKTVFRGYDTENGIDVAWCKVHDTDVQTDGGNTLSTIFGEMRKGLTLDHANIIRCFACWQDDFEHCINLITELFTSGTLRSYLITYRNVDLNVHRKYVRQILNGLIYLHTQTPPLVHADLRLDKIYVNGFNGEVKIGDLGLASLLARRYRHATRPEFDSPLEDLLALGLCVYELLTGTQLDREHAADTLQRTIQIQAVKDSDGRDFITQCVMAESHPLTAASLSTHPFLHPKSTELRVNKGGEWDLGRIESERSLSRSTKLKGEDFTFEFQVPPHPPTPMPLFGDDGACRESSQTLTNR